MVLYTYYIKESKVSLNNGDLNSKCEYILNVIFVTYDVFNVFNVHWMTPFCCLPLVVNL